MIDGLEVSTPAGFQEVLFSDTFPSSFLNQYDKVILVVDSRASDNKRVKEHL